jgi:hypothetical protein
MPKTGLLWKSVSLGGLLLDIAPWRFRYRVDVRTEALVVEEAQLRGDP